MVWKSPVIPWDQCTEERRADLRIAWLRGELAYKLDPDQQTVRDQVYASHAKAQFAPERQFVLDCSRRYGKDSIMATLGVETCIRRPGCRFPYGAPTQKMVVEILEPIVEWVLIDCPPELRPVHNRTRHEWVFANGSRIILVGCDLHPDRLRGSSTGGWALTEPGFIADLDKLITSVLVPQMLTEPDSFGVMGSTPPESPSHPWTCMVVPKARARGFYAHRTIFNNPRITDEMRNAFIAEAGGIDSTQCRREYLAEHVVETTKAVIPEFQRVKGKPDGSGGYTGGCVVEREPPKYRDCYVAMDPGWSDLCAVLFAYWDFERAVLYVEDCFALPQANSAIVAAEIRKREAALWTGVEAWANGRMQSQPYKRVSDTDLRMIGDMTQVHGLRFAPTRKDDRDAAINALRVRVSEGKIEIHPRCKDLIAHIDFAIWNKSRTEFERSGEWGHFDCVAALVYLDRNIDRHRNPFPPALYGVDTSGMFVPQELRQTQKDPLTQMFPKAAKRHEMLQRSRQARRI